MGVWLNWLDSWTKRRNIYIKVNQTMCPTTSPTLYVRVKVGQRRKEALNPHFVPSTFHFATDGDNDGDDECLRKKRSSYL